MYAVKFSEYDGASDTRRREMWKRNTYAFIGKYAAVPFLCGGVVSLALGAVGYLVETLFRIQ